MKYLLIRADDVGYSYAVDLGIERSVDVYKRQGCRARRRRGPNPS